MNPNSKQFLIFVETVLSTRVLQKVLLYTKYYIISDAYPYLVYFNLLRNFLRYNKQKLSSINHNTISLNAAELSTLMPLQVKCTGKSNFCSHFHIVKLINFEMGNGHKI